MPDLYCLSPSYVVFKRVYAGHAVDEESRYSFITKLGLKVGVPSATSGGVFNITATTILDLYQVAPGQIRYAYGSAVSGDVFYGIPPVGARTLLKVEASGGKIKTWQFAIATKTVVYTEYVTEVPCHPGFSLSEDVVLSASCEGTTRVEYFHDGAGGLNIVTTPFSTICGYTPPADNVVITVKQRVRIEHDCPINPIMLKWKLSLGGWDQWLFSKTQTKKLTTSSKGSVSTPVWDIENAESTIKEVGKNRTNSIILGAANLTKNDKEGIEELLSSNIIYQIDQSGKKVARVMVLPGTFTSIETGEILQSIEFEIIVNETYTISN